MATQPVAALFVDLCLAGSGAVLDEEKGEQQQPGGHARLSLDSEQWIPSPKNLFQIVVQHFRPRLQEYVGAPFLAARNHGPYRSHRTNARFLPKAGSLHHRKCGGQGTCR